MLQMKYLSPFHWIIDKIHVDIDGVYVWNAVLDPDLCVPQLGPGECGHGELCLVKPNQDVYRPEPLAQVPSPYTSYQR